MTAEIISDGTTVWVNAPDGGCIGRFSKRGVDVHLSADEQIRQGRQCLDCTHGKPGPAEWHRFKTGMQKHHGVAVSDRHRPGWLSADKTEA